MFDCRMNSEYGCVEGARPRYEHALDRGKKTPMALTRKSPLPVELGKGYSIGSSDRRSEALATYFRIRWCWLVIPSGHVCTMPCLSTALLPAILPSITGYFDWRVHRSRWIVFRCQRNTRPRECRDDLRSRSLYRVSIFSTLHVPLSEMRSISFYSGLI